LRRRVRDVRAQSPSERRCARRAEKPRFKARLMPPGFLRCRHRRREIRVTRFRIRERLRIACAPLLLNCFLIRRDYETEYEEWQAEYSGAPQRVPRACVLVRAFALGFVIVNRRQAAPT
jgi:hypothetical protein